MAKYFIALLALAAVFAADGECNVCLFVLCAIKASLRTYVWITL